MVQPGEWKEYAEARGKITIPCKMNLWLSVSYKAMFDLTPLSHLNADDLQELSITSSHEFDDIQLRNIESLTGLTGLALWETKTGDNTFSRLSHFSNLRWLDIGDTKITNDGLAFIKNMTCLEELSLLNNEIEDRGLRHLEGLKMLKRLDLMGTKVGDLSFEILQNMKGLEHLRIVDTNISYPIFAKLKLALPNSHISYHEFAR